MKKLLFVVGIFSLFACSKNSSVKMKGSDTEVNLAVNLAEKYTEINPKFSIAISGGGSGLGITSLLNGQADIANSSRPLSDEEKQQFKDMNIELKTVVFAEDATAFIVHKDLPLTEIDLPTLGKILSGEITNWSEITDSNLPINIYGRQSSSGTHSFVKKKLKIEFSNAAKEMTGNAQILEGVKADKSGIGYVGAGYVGHDPAVNTAFKILKIKETKTSEAYSPIDPNTINNSLYFFQRPLYQFVLADSWEKVKPFIDFEKSAKGKKMIEEHGYYVIEKK
ncbi:PstS family phosphate ABC transporter substrate-binding protein [Flavobacterium sp. xlx-214]|uniref:PstS family phosphate ABC transporter substrate-binding protein n=1 Tax=unclassified Flavobacterium TaxID=196869 RepID=UPI0013D5CC07|nr:MULTISPECIES: PstS family phosphate ABC transporter substrate-binding protein [unclassified Flavobacterium]MBA5791830.1 PstS family phosphate ABC transporter substrate-binding protein [Flavobacterium sp. xlx-221]QMI83067.1 PstS family phosphate ABC transporter substrate-binding protein [Flavobacterium sp. xlx-214]